MTTTRHANALHGLIAAALLVGLGLGAQAVAGALPEKAEALVALPEAAGGCWLALRKNGLALLDARGQELARHAVRGKHLDARLDAAGGIAVLLDANAERVVLLRIDLAAKRLTPLPALPAPSESVSALCLYRDGQKLDQLFVVGESGITEQWVLRGDEALPLRRLALPAKAEQCQVDDARARLVVREPGGVWAYRAEAEGHAKQEPIALRKPWGALDGGGGALAVLPSDVVVVNEGPRLRLFDGRSKSQGKPARTIELPKNVEPDAMAWLPATAQLAVRDDATGRWSPHALPAWPAAPVPAALPVVMPSAQTTPVAQFGDAADDPAVWVHPADRARSVIVSTDKKRGLAVHDLQGRERQFLAIGRVNNVDLRQDLRLGASAAPVDLAVATQRDDNTVVVLRIDGDGTLSEWARLPTGFSDAYGLCLRRTPSGAAEVFVNDKSGKVLQLRIEAGADGRPVGKRLREFSLRSQPEGCVVDDAAGRVFLGEEKRGVWSFGADAGDASKPPADLKLVLPVGGLMQADVEGMGLIRSGAGHYLVVSSQGNDSYVVLDAEPPHRVRGAFRIGINLDARIDGTSETDGLEVIAGNFGPAFPNGLLVVQDGHKRLPDGPQNFKLVSWDEVVKALKLP